jgi:hypothetical protein
MNSLLSDPDDIGRASDMANSRDNEAASRRDHCGSYSNPATINESARDITHGPAAIQMQSQVRSHIVYREQQQQLTNFLF